MQTQCERSSYTERNSKRRDEHQPSSRCSENRMLLHRKSRTPRRMMRRQVGTIVRCQVAGSTVVLEYIRTIYWIQLMNCRLLLTLPQRVWRAMLHPRCFESLQL
jgi:hypothetical protein